MNEIWALVEISAGKLPRSSREALCEAVRQGRKLRVGTAALVLGGRVSDRVRDELAAFGPDSIFALTADIDAAVSPGAYIDPLVRLLAAHRPTALLAGSSVTFREVAPRVAARLGCGLVTEATFLNRLDDGFVVTRPAFRPHASMVTAFREGTMQVICMAAKAVEIETARTPAPHVPKYTVQALTVEHDAVEVERILSELPAHIDLADAPIVVAGGRGMQCKENFRLLDELADVLGGTVGASRMAVDLQWCSRDCLVGVTGKIVSPELYVACGISGAVQHLMGMRAAETVVAINIDPGAPIFRVATVGIVGDVREVLPVMIESFRRGRASGTNLERVA